MDSSTEKKLADHDRGYGDVTARYYDDSYGTFDSLGADVSFYRGLALESGGPVLELGCGTGRALLDIASARPEMSITGLDASAAMLRVLAAKPGAKDLTLVRARMQDFELSGERFALVFSAFRAFQHLDDIDDQLACLRCVRRHLRPGGTIAFDVFNPRLERLAVDEEPWREELTFEHEGDPVTRFLRVVRDRPRQVQTITFRYERRRAGALLSSEEVEFTMRWFHRYELEHLMERAGFVDVRIFGDFDQSPVAPGSPAFVVVARTAET